MDTEKNYMRYQFHFLVYIYKELIFLFNFEITKLSC